MPWKFIRPTDDVARDRRQQTLARIARWWDAFALKAPEIASLFRGESEWDAGGWMDAELGAIDPRLRYEFGATADGGFDLVITPDAARALRPMVQSLLDAAPEIAGWSFYGYRQPAAPEAADEIVRQRTGHGLTFATVQAHIGAAHRIDLTFQHKLAATDERTAVVVATEAARVLLGEALFDQWVGDVDVTEPTRELGPEQFLPLVRLQPTVLALAGTIAGKLPGYPYYEISSRSLPSSGFKRHAPAAPDYTGESDMIVGSTMLPDLRRAIESPRPFYSTSFSRQGETFCYLKIDVPDVSTEERFVRKQQFEEALNRPLRRAKAARIIGSGTGLRYIYFDLAAADLAKTVEAIHVNWAALNPPDRAWLLFHDAELAGEYVGMKASTPPPPGFEGV